jgi:hypothetical protein
MVMVTAMVWSSLINSLTSPTRPALYPLLHESPYTRVILLLAALVETSPACFAPAHANAAFPWASPWSLSWARHALPCPCFAFPMPIVCLAHATHASSILHTLTQSYTHDTLINQSSVISHPCLYRPPPIPAYSKIYLVTLTAIPFSVHASVPHPSIPSTTLPSIVEERERESESERKKNGTNMDQNRIHLHPPYARRR